MFQFSLRNLLVAVTAVAVGTAALHNANSWWASLLWAAALLMLAFAGLMAFLRREAKRAYWSTYVAAGSLYLLLLIYSVPQYSQSNTWMPYGPLNHDNLATTKVIHWTYSLLPASKTTPNLPVQPGGSVPAGTLLLSFTAVGGQIVQSGQTVPNGPGGVTMLGFGQTGAPPNPAYIDPEVFSQVDHALWMFLISWLGGTVAFLMFRSRERPSIAPTTTPP